MNKLNCRIGQIVPGSNTTMETEIPAMLRARSDRARAPIPIVEDMYGLPVLSAASCTVYTMLQRQGIERKAPNAGRLLGGNY
ncbi:MAG: hypothetical protein V4632_22920 [Pseudomonadota bacterium]